MLYLYPIFVSCEYIVYALCVGLSGKMEESSGENNNNHDSSKFTCIIWSTACTRNIIFADAAVTASVSVVVVLITIATLALIIFGVILYLRKRYVIVHIVTAVCMFIYLMYP